VQTRTVFLSRKAAEMLQEWLKARDRERSGENGDAGIPVAEDVRVGLFVRRRV